MKRTLFTALATLTLLTGAALAEKKTYQVTGPILALTDNTITVQKGTEKWEINRDAATGIVGELKVGAKVTIEYTMNATTVTAKDDKAKATPAPKATPAAKAADAKPADATTPDAAKATPAAKKKK